MRRIILLIVLSVLIMLPVAVPAAAQDRIPVPDITRYAEYAPWDAVMYGAVRTDIGFRESLSALFDRLEPLIGRTDFEDVLDDIFNTPEMSGFLGDAIALTVLSAEADFDDLLGDDALVTLTFGVKDNASAKAFIEDNMDERPTERNGWQVYTVEDDVRIMLRGDVMVVTPHFPYTEQLLSGDYGKLSADRNFLAALGRLPADHYDVLLYADLGAIIQGKAARNAEMAEALAGAAGQWAFGGVNVGGRDLILDIAWNYGDLSGMAAHGFTAETLTGPPVDLTFARHAAGATQFYMQSKNFGGLISQTVGLVNAIGSLMENEASTEYFGLEGIINARSGDTLQAALALGLAAATGLNLQSDVIDVLRGDFALMFSVVPLQSALEYAPALGLILDESGQGAKYLSALVNALDRSGLRINRIPSRDGEALDLSAFTDPLFVDMTGLTLAADDPNYDVWFGVGGGVMALGNAPVVQQALRPGEETLTDHPAYRHAVELTFLPDAQGIIFINVGALGVVEGVSSDLTRIVESVAASERADAQGIVGRLAITLK